jgi:hypothetical protein
MYPRGFSTELWVEMMWSFVWILMVPGAMTLILLIVSVLAEIVSREKSDSQNRNII